MKSNKKGKKVKRKNGGKGKGDVFIDFENQSEEGEVDEITSRQIGEQILEDKESRLSNQKYADEEHVKKSIEVMHKKLRTQMTRSK